MSRTHGRGFTLIELMITVAIVAILASIAYPSYRSYVLKSKRAEGRAALTELLQEQERYMAQRNTYATFPAGDASVPFKTFAGDKLAGAPYHLGAEACNGAVSIKLCVRVIAVPQPTGSDPEAGTLRAESTGAKDCVGGSKPTVCWK